MKSILIVRSLAFAVGLSMSLNACQNGVTATPPEVQSVATAAGTISAAVLPDAAVAALKDTCAKAGPLLSAAASPAAPAVVSGWAVDGNAYCQQLAASPAGTVPATTDSNTPKWLPEVIAGVQVVGEVAKYALPAILAVL